MRCVACGTGPATQPKLAIVTVGTRFSDNFPTEMLLPPWAVMSPPILLILRAGGQTAWNKTQRAYNTLPCLKTTDKCWLHKHSSLQVAHLSIGGNLSLCLTEPRAAMQKCCSGSCSSSQLRPPCLPGRCGAGGGRLGQVPHRLVPRTGDWLILERMSYLSPRGPPQFFPFTGML